MSEVITGGTCPCCGDIALPKWCSVSKPNESESYGLSSEVRYYYECRKCGLRTKDFPTEKAALKAWNTRYERTCKMIMYEGSPACSECYRELDYDSKFCDSCGAKVVEL